jgi:transposase
VLKSSKRYTEEFKGAAVRQVTERGYGVLEVAAWLGTTTHSLYPWLRRYGAGLGSPPELHEHQVENQRLKAKLKRVTEERDILKKAAAYFAKVCG